MIQTLNIENKTNVYESENWAIFPQRHFETNPCPMRCKIRISSCGAVSGTTFIPFMGENDGV
jgi:hypothetical protein